MITSTELAALVLSRNTLVYAVHPVAMFGERIVNSRGELCTDAVTRHDWYRLDHDLEVWEILPFFDAFLSQELRMIVAEVGSKRESNRLNGNAMFASVRAKLKKQCAATMRADGLVVASLTDENVQGG